MDLTTRPRWIYVLVWPLYLASCAGAESHVAVEVEEEDGVRVVINHEPELPLGAWQVGPADVEIGEVDGAEPYLFQRIIQAQVDDERRIVVVDAGASEIRIYSPDGVHQSSHGGRGEGPGEFQNVVAAQRMTGDTIVLTEFLGRVSLFTGDGEFVRVWTPAERSGTLYYFPNDQYLWVLVPPLPVDRDGHQRPTHHVMMGSPAGPGSDTLAVLPGQETIVVRTGTSVQNVQVPFASGAIHTVDPRGRLVLSQDGYEVGLRSISPGEATTARVARDREPLTDGEWQAAVAADLARYDRGRFATPAGRQARERALQMVERPMHKPLFDQLEVDRQGNVWARLAAEELETLTEREWTVFDPSGRWMTTVLMPADIAVLDIGSDYVLARWTGDLGVQKVRLHSLIKSR